MRPGPNALVKSYWRPSLLAAELGRPQRTHIAVAVHGCSSATGQGVHHEAGLLLAAAVDGLHRTEGRPGPVLIAVIAAVVALEFGTQAAAEAPAEREDRGKSAAEVRALVGDGDAAEDV